MHPSSGYVDERVVSGVAQVGQLCAHAYNFEGLVHFEAIVAEVSVKYNGDYYQIAGNAKKLATIQQRLRALNAAGQEPLFTILSRS